MFEIGSFVRVTKKDSRFYNNIMRITKLYSSDAARIYPVNNGDIQTYIYFLNSRGYNNDHSWLILNNNLEQVNEEDYYKDMYM